MTTCGNPWHGPSNNPHSVPSIPRISVENRNGISLGCRVVTGRKTRLTLRACVYYILNNGMAERFEAHYFRWRIPTFGMRGRRFTSPSRNRHIVLDSHRNPAHAIRRHLHVEDSWMSIGGPVIDDRRLWASTRRLLVIGEKMHSRTRKKKRKQKEKERTRERGGGGDKVL